MLDVDLGVRRAPLRQQRLGSLAERAMLRLRQPTVIEIAHEAFNGA
jgi:hypothetical protein